MFWPQSNHFDCLVYNCNKNQLFLALFDNVKIILGSSFNNVYIYIYSLSIFYSLTLSLSVFFVQAVKLMTIYIYEPLIVISSATIPVFFLTNSTI